MPPRSALAIASGAVQRLLKEEASYRKELADQEAQVAALERGQSGGGDDGNAAFMLKQQRTAVEQTKAVFGPLKARTADAVATLEEHVALGGDAGAHAADMDQAKAVLAQVKEVLAQAGLAQAKAAA